MVARFIHVAMKERIHLQDVDFRENIIAFADAKRQPWYVSQLVFWLTSLLTLSWPLRVLIEYKTA